VVLGLAAYQLIRNFRQLLALVSDQNFKDSCDKTVIFEVECVSLHEVVVFEYLGQT